MIPATADRTSAFSQGRTLKEPTMRSSVLPTNMIATTSPARTANLMRPFHARRFLLLDSERSFFLDSLRSGFVDSTRATVLGSTTSDVLDTAGAGVSTLDSAGAGAGVLASMGVASGVFGSIDV